MDDDIETLMVEVRANTSGFRSDMESMRGALDASLLDGFAKASDVLEKGLLSAIGRGRLGFDELKAVALSTMQQIAQQLMQSGLGAIFGQQSQFAPALNLGGLLQGLFGTLGGGMPGRATGGPVAPGAAYMVGERGPELFVPTSAGRVEANAGNPQRDVRVAINLAAPRGTENPVMLRRSSRQVASAVARAMKDF